jgi:hypothetical protein
MRSKPDQASVGSEDCLRKLLVCRDLILKRSEIAIAFPQFAPQYASLMVELGDTRGILVPQRDYLFRAVSVGERECQGRRGSRYRGDAPQAGNTVMLILHRFYPGMWVAPRSTKKSGHDGWATRQS